MLGWVGCVLNLYSLHFLFALSLYFGQAQEAMLPYLGWYVCSAGESAFCHQTFFGYEGTLGPRSELRDPSLSILPVWVGKKTEVMEDHICGCCVGLSLPEELYLLKWTAHLDNSICICNIIDDHSKGFNVCPHVLHLFGSLWTSIGMFCNLI